MTAIPSARSGRRAAPAPATPEAAPVKWDMVAVIVAILTQAAAGVWFASDLNRRVSGIEEELPAGAVARMDERTLQIQHAIDRLERRP